MAGKRVACGKALWPNTAVHITKFVVDRPSSGYPAQFTVTGCGLGLHAGETVLLQRLPGGAEDDLHLGGTLRVVDLAKLGGAAAAIGFTATVSWVAFVAVIRPRWRRWVDAGRDKSA